MVNQMVEMSQIILENYWRFFKGNILQKQRKIRQLPFHEIKKIQWKRLKKLLDYVYNNNEFYKNYFESVNLIPDDIKEPYDMLKLPFTEKKTYKQNFNKIISKDININNFPLSCTSGSTGEPFTFYTDKIRETDSMYAAFVLNKETMGIIPFKKINELELKTNPRNAILDINKFKIKSDDIFKNLFISKHIGIRSMNIKPENVDNIIKIIEHNKIKTIYGYSSSVLTLAEYLSKYDYKIKMKYIIVMGEELLEQQRSIISKTFNCSVYMEYGSSECMRMGFECRYQNGYHMDIYNHYFEYLKDNDYAKNNEIGNLVVTNLNNYIFPFIRYRVGDAVLVSDQVCQCGINLPMVKKIYGRITDPIKTPSGNELSGGIFFVEFEYLYDYVNQFRVIQTKKDELLVKIVPNEKMNEEQRRNIEKLIYRLTDESMKVQVVLVPEITTLKSGKKRTVISKEEYERLIKNGEIL
jgi:phenylacetate-CoA ligase